MKAKTVIPSTLVLLALLLASGCSLGIPGAAASAVAGSTPSPVASPIPAGVSSTASASAVAALEGVLQQVYVQVNPSVVNVQVIQQQEGVTSSFPEIRGLPFQFPAPQEPQTQRRLGSGFVWDQEGHIVTNNHVVDGADKITVVFYDGSRVTAELVGADRDSDLAVIKVDRPASQLQPVQVADSDQVHVGELAVAIGNPFGLEGTMTVGIVSALGRTLPVESQDIQGGPTYSIPDVIQTDAPINPGNSGGVLLDDQGKVIGVTTAIQSPVRANAGIGFAIPSNIVQKFVPVLIEKGHYEHPWLGISGLSLTPDLAQAMDLEPDQRGALVSEVVPGSPADEAGLRGSDRQATIEGAEVRVGGNIVVAIDDQPVMAMDALIAYLARHTEIGQDVGLTIVRGGKEQTVDVTLAARPAAETSQSRAETAPGVSGGAWLGIVGTTVTPDIARAMNLPGEQQGVLVEQVEKGSPADQAGLRGSYKPVTVQGQQLLVGGDVVTTVGDQQITAIEELRAAIQQSDPGQEITLVLLRDGDKHTVNVTLAERPASTP